MDTIKISQDSLDAFRKEKSLIPAPIDNKNILQDWIEYIFDYQSCIWGEKNRAIGFICGQAVLATWDGNNLLWTFTEKASINGSEYLSALRKRLESAHDPNGNLVEFFKVVGNSLWQTFYWKDED